MAMLTLSVTYVKAKAYPQFLANICEVANFSLLRIPRSSDTLLLHENQ
jgi:hypothetical protein